jgi:hypothetical protein
MRMFLLFTVALTLASTASAQSSNPSADARGGKPSAPRGISNRQPQPARTNYQLHAHLYTPCCAVGAESGGFDAGSGWAGEPDTVVTAQGEPGWAPSRYVKFSKAVRIGKQQAPAPPSAGQVPSPNAVQQMLYLIQQDRINAASAARTRAPAHASLASSDEDADADAPYVPFDQALALGEAEIAAEQAAENPPPLGDVARDDAAEKSSEPKAELKIKQDADGNAVIVEKKPK